MDDKKIEELTKRLVDIIPPWDKEEGIEEATRETIINNPLCVIEFLLDFYEE